MDLVASDFRMVPSGVRRVLPDNVREMGKPRFLTGVGTRSVTGRCPGSVIVNTSASIFLNSAILNGPGDERTTFGVLGLLSNGARTIVANYTVVGSSGVSDFSIMDRIRFFALSSTRVGTCLSASRPCSGTKDCNVRTGNKLFIGRVHNSCFGVMNLPVNRLGHRLGGFMWGTGPSLLSGQKLWCLVDCLGGEKDFSEGVVSSQSTTSPSTGGTRTTTSVPPTTSAEFLATIGSSPILVASSAVDAFLPLVVLASLSPECGYYSFLIIVRLARASGKLHVWALAPFLTVVCNFPSYLSVSWTVKVLLTSKIGVASGSKDFLDGSSLTLAMDSASPGVVGTTVSGLSFAKGFSD